MEALRQQKALETFLGNLYQKQVKVESILLALIEADTSLSTFSSLKAAVHGNKHSIPFQDIEQLRDDMEDQRAMQEELNSVVAGKDPAEEEELERELEALEASEWAKQLEEMPAVPTGEVKEGQKQGRHLVT